MTLYLQYTITTNVAQRAQRQPPYGPGFSGRLLKMGASMDVWAYPLGQPKEDDLLFVLKDAAGVELARREVQNYLDKAEVA